MISLKKVSENNLEEKMGIFTIYYKPIFSEHDLIFKKKNDKEKFLQNFNRRFFNKFQAQPLNINANLGSTEEFSGNIEQIKTDIKDKVFENKYKETEFKFEKLITENSNKSNLLKLYYSMSTSVLSPIHTEFSLDLREDILALKDKYFEAKEIRKHSSAMYDDIASKLASIGKPDEIIIDFQYFNNIDASRGELADIGIVLEWILKQQIRNMLGFNDD